MSFLRARDETAKCARRRQLLAAAVGRFDAAGYAATTMAQVAAEAGLAKGTTYLYFRSKEELFLELLLEELGAWVEVAAVEVGEPSKAKKAEKEEAAEKAEKTEKEERAERAERAERGDSGAVAVAAALAESVGSRPRLVRLLALRAPVLEPGAGAETVRRCRERQLDLVAPLADRLAVAIPGLGAEGGRATIALLLALAAGFADRLEPLAASGEEGSRRPDPSREPLERGFVAEVFPSIELFLRSERKPPAATPPAP